jgi:hypothetical protein
MGMKSNGNGHSSFITQISRSANPVQQCAGMSIFFSVLASVYNRPLLENECLFHQYYTRNQVFFIGSILVFGFPGSLRSLPNSHWPPRPPMVHGGWWKGWMTSCLRPAKRLQRLRSESAPEVSARDVDVRHRYTRYTDRRTLSRYVPGRNPSQTGSRRRVEVPYEHRRLKNPSNRIVPASKAAACGRGRGILREKIRMPATTGSHRLRVFESRRENGTQCVCVMTRSP